MRFLELCRPRFSRDLSRPLGWLLARVRNASAIVWVSLDRGVAIVTACEWASGRLDCECALASSSAGCTAETRVAHDWKRPKDGASETAEWAASGRRLLGRLERSGCTAAVFVPTERDTGSRPEEREGRAARSGTASWPTKLGARCPRTPTSRSNHSQSEFIRTQTGCSSILEDPSPRRR